MASVNIFGIRITMENLVAPTPDNDNLELMTGCVLTPAEVRQWAKRRRQRLSRALAKNPQLWNCPEHRRTWNATLGIEKLVLSQCYGIRGA
jgi:hypothetical protein